MKTNLQNPINPSSFGRSGSYRAYTAAEKIESKQRVFTPYCRDYNPATEIAPIRPGSQDALACPSRIGDVPYYRSGEVELDPINHTPKPVYSLY